MQRSPPVQLPTFSALFSPEEVKTILAEAEDVDAMGFHKGDVLFTEGGDRDKLAGWSEVRRSRIVFTRTTSSVQCHAQRWSSQSLFRFTAISLGSSGSTERNRRPTWSIRVSDDFPYPAPLMSSPSIVTKVEELFSEPLCW